MRRTLPLLVPLLLYAALVFGQATPTATPTVTSVTITGTTTVQQGGTSQLAATDNLAENITALCSWDSANPTIALINQQGLLSAIGVGSTTVVATYKGINGVATVSVNPSPTPATPTATPT